MITPYFMTIRRFVLKLWGDKLSALALLAIEHVHFCLFAVFSAFVLETHKPNMLIFVQ